MRHLIFRIFLILIIGFMLFSYVFPWKTFGVENFPFTGKDYKLGLDLQGGIELDYKIDLEEVRAEEDYTPTKELEIIEGLKSIIDKRIETLNINDSVITSSNYGGEQHIIVQIPLKGNDSFQNKENIKRAKDAIGKVVKIQFKEKRVGISEEDLDLRAEIADKVLLDVKSGEDFSVLMNKYELNYDKILVGTINDLSDLVEITDGIEDRKVNEVVLVDGEEGFLITKTSEESISYIYVSKLPSDWVNASDSNGRELNDKYFVKSSVQYNDAFTPMVELVFNDEGAEIFAELTSRLVGDQIAIFVGGEILTAPTVNQTIYGGKAVITGDYTPEEAKQLASDINTGVVPAPIYLTSEKTIDSKLGASSLEKLVVSGIIGFVIIFAFLIVIYRLSGLMATIALFSYVILVLSVIKVFGTVLTLASIAGLILSIGMAIDANVLIFERIKNELDKGNSIKDATTIGFKKSWSAIWDSNVTGFIVAMILFVFGINLIKGFGLMLAIGIVVSLFTAMWISRILLNLLSETGVKSKSFIGK